jgi:hypothetical protein
MALQTINIDDRNFDQLLEELKNHIPVSQWTDHHPSDPGIMLLELFAWLGEMTLYQMNRIPETHQEKFLKLIIDPPEPVTVDVKLLIQLSKDRGQDEDVSIPAGTRFATDFKNNKRYVFETFRQILIPPPTVEEKSNTSQLIQRYIEVKARCFKEIKHEVLGVSRDTPNQTFPLKHSPVLLDFVYSTHEYNPNPIVFVDGEAWEPKPFLLTEDSQGAVKHFMVDAFDNAVRFGDGAYGDIPPGNAAITCAYRVLPGPEALIKAGELKHILDDIQGLKYQGEAVSIHAHKDAEGGMYFVEKQERFRKGLENFKKTFRLITAEDFQYVLLTDFNQLQQRIRNNPFNELEEKPLAQLPQSTYKVYRAEAVMNQKLTGPSSLEERPGHVTILVIPECQPNESPPYYTEEMLQLHDELKDKMKRFLEKRKLIATHLHFMPAALKKIDIEMKVVILKERDTEEMEETIKKHVYDFMDILHGGIDKKGWPPGKNLYKSHLYRLVEEIDGADYVKSLTFAQALSHEKNCVEINPHELPVIQNLEVTVERG